MNSSARAFLSLLILGLTGTGIYFGVVEVRGIYKDMEKTSLKKQISVKPENIKGHQALMETRSIKKEELTFFDILDDPSMSKYIGLNESIFYSQETINNLSNFDSKVKNNISSQFDGMNANKTLSPPASQIQTQKHDEFFESGFVLQVGSFKTLEKANLLKKNLGKKGYPVFVEMARILGGDRVWHRVVIGRFSEKAAAVKTAIKLEEKENLDSVMKWQESLSPEVYP